jgi:hypothetical protein
MKAPCKLLRKHGNFRNAGFAALLALAALLSAAQAQTQLTGSYTNSFPTAGSTSPFAGSGSVASWIYWYGLNYNNTPVTNDPTMDATGQTNNSGSLMVYLPFGAPYEGSVFFGTFGNEGAYDGSETIDARNYTNLAFDILFASGTPLSPNGDLGAITMSIFPAWENGGDFNLFPSVTIPASARTNWFHGVASITNFLANEPVASLANCAGLGFDYNNSGGYPTNPVTFWLDNVAVVSDGGPLLIITSPLNNAALTAPSLTVSGTASDNGLGNNGIASVSVNGVLASGGSASGAATANWSASVPLGPEVNTITVVATDSTGRASTTSITVTTPDTSPPALTITSPLNNAPVTTPSLTVTGTASDNGLGDNGIYFVDVNGLGSSGGSASGAATANWSATVPLTPGANIITVVAEDLAYNASTSTINVTYNPVGSGSYTNSFFSGGGASPFTGGSVASWIYWYGLGYNNTPMTNDPTMDAGGQTNTSGSLMVYLPFGASGDQGVFFGTFGNRYGYDGSVTLDARNYTALAFDIHFAPATPLSMTGDLGAITTSMFPGAENGGDFYLFPSVTIPASARTNWFHAMVSITNFLANEPAASMANCDGIGFNYNSFSGYPVNPVTFWLDNVSVIMNPNRVAPPVINPSGGKLTNGQTVTMTTTTPGASIRYTIDGSLPTPATGVLYTGPIPFSLIKSMTLKAVAYATNMADSAVITGQYDPPSAMTVGQNLEGVSDFSHDWPFVDVFKRTRPWMTRNLDGSGAWDSGFGPLILVDTNGWPTQVPFAVNGTNQLVHTIIVNLNEAGAYNFIYEGTGMLYFSCYPGASASLTATGGVQSFSFTAPIDGAQAIVEIHRSATNDYLRNFHIVLTNSLAAYATQPFHPLFLQRLEPFTCLRFMQWADINGTGLVSWTNRPAPNYYTQENTNGVALEYMVQLCNTLQKDAWICIPHAADDDYVRQTAQLLLNSLSPNLRVYVEYSNETWNSGFPQEGYVQAQGVNLGLDPDPFTAGQKYVARRSGQIWSVFQQVFGGATGSRLVKVMASAWYGAAVMRVSGLLDPGINVSGVLPDALAIATYFDTPFTPANLPPFAPYPTVDEIVTNLAVQAIAEVQAQVAQQKPLADTNGWRLVCYEGGQGFVGSGGAQNDTNLTAILAAANRDPRMLPLYTRFLDMLNAQGVDFFNNYSYCGNWSQYGSWGSLEFQNQPTNAAPKYAALVQWIAAHPGNVTWPAPADITYGMPLGAAQLNATASAAEMAVPGTFSYSPPPGTILSAGNAQTLSVVFTPTDTVDFQTMTATVGINILKAPLTVTGLTAANKTYDGGTVATITGTPALAGVIGGDAVSVAGAAVGAFASKTVGGNQTVTVSGLSLTGSNSGNYTLTIPNLTASITPAGLTVTGLAAANKTYDGGTTATITGTATLAGVIGSDAVSAGGTPAGAFASGAVGNNKTVTVGGLSLAGSASGNYTLTSPSLIASIIPAGLTVTGLTAANKTYDGGTTAAIIGTAALAGVIGRDAVSVTGTPTGAFASKTAGNSKSVTASGLTLSGSDAGNYALTPPTLVASITPAGLTVTGLAAANKTYDGGTTATITGTAALAGVIGGDAVSAAATPTGAFATRTVGSNKTVAVSGLSLAGADSGNYTLTPPGLTANITPTGLTVTSLAAANKTYDGGTTATVTGTAALAGVIGSDAVSVAGTPTGAFASKTAGINKSVTVDGLSLGGTDSGNYTVTLPSLTANISPAGLTVTGLQAANKTYDGGTTATVTGMAALAGVIGSDAILAGGTPMGAFASKTAGNNKTVTLSGLALAGADSGNYTMTLSSLIANITPAGLTVTGLQAGDKTYDGGTTATVTGTAALAGVIGSDAVLAAGTPTGAFAGKTVGNSKTVIVSGLSLAGADSGNYTLTPPGLSANITPAGLTVTGLAAANKTYDGGVSATISGTAALAGVIGNDAVSATGMPTAAFASKTVGNNKTVTVGGLSLAGADSANYTVTLPNLTANISATGLTVTGLTAASKTYDGGTSATITGTTVLVGVIGSDAVTSAGTPTGAFASKTVGNNKTVAVGGLSLAGADSGNYTLTAPTLTANITPAGLTVTGLTASNKTYDSGTTATISGTAALAGVLGSDAVSAAGTPTGAFASKTAGSNQSVTVSGLVLAGADSGNYTLASPSLSANITPAALTVSADNASRLVGMPNPTFTGVVTGVQPGDNITASYISAATTGSPAGAYPIVPQLSDPGSALGNYTVTIQNGILTVSSSAITITNAGLAGGTFTLSVQTQIGLTYILESKDRLSDANWAQVQSAAGNGATMALSDPNAIVAARFYRVRAQ